LAQIATLLSQREKKVFGAYLLGRAEKMLAEAATNEEERGIRHRICAALSQPSINRLRAYADGKHFPTPKIVRALAGALDDNPLSLLRFAGYDREAICDLNDLRVADRGAKRSGLTREVIEYAVRLFPRRGERYRERRAYADALLETLSFSIGSVSAHRPLARPLSRAYDILADASLEADCRRAIASELVRSWTYAVDATFARSIEHATYVRIPEIGEPPGIPFLPIGPFTRALNATRRHP
jgi:hypothetical protein